MKTLLAVLCTLSLFATPVLAQDKKDAQKEPTAAQKKKQTEQQNRMKDCNKQAGDKGMKGDERKKFMSACLKG